MFKKLDSLVIKAFIGPFLATFFVAILVITLQFFWLYIDDLVGKGLDALTLFKLIGLVVLHGLPLAMPLAMLLSSIITFGNLGETFEIVAIKAAGISLLRFMKPLFYVTVVITIFTFICLNYFIPVAELKLETLKHDIIVKQPALDIKEGVFYNKLNGYVIRVGKKQNDSIVKNVVIFEKNNLIQDNIITAESGLMRISNNKKYLEFTLYNGWRCQEQGDKATGKTDFVRMGFKQYKKLLDLSNLQMQKTDDEVFKQNAKMLSIRQIDKTLDSLEKHDSIVFARVSNEPQSFLNFTKYRNEKFENKKPLKTFQVPDTLKNLVYESAAGSISSALSSMFPIASDYTMYSQNLLTFKIEWHKRFTFSLACFAMFLIGAPLGSIIRKGGMGTPFVFAIVFFSIFHLLNTFGDKFAQEQVLSSFWGIWLSNIVLISIGLFLVSKAMKDSQLFNNEFYFRVFRLIKNKIARKK